MLKIFSKIVSGLLVASMLITLIPCVTFAMDGDYPTLIYMHRDFEDQQAGDAPWNFHQSSYRGPAVLDDFTVAEIPRDGNDSNKAMYVKNIGHQDERKAATHVSYAPLKHKVVFGFDFYLTNPGVENKITMHVDNMSNGSNFTETSGKNVSFINLGERLEVSTTAINGVSLEKNRWYDLKLELDAGARRANVYLDGELKQKGVSLGTFVDISGFSFVAPNNGGDYYIDNFVLYKSDYILSDEEYADALNLWLDSPLCSEGEYAQGRHRQYDRIGWHTIYGHRVAKLGTRQMWNKDDFVQLNGPIKNIDGEINVPLRGFGDIFGAEVKWHGESNKVSLSKNGDTLEFIEGSDNYFKNGNMKKMTTPAFVENGVFYAHIETVKDLLGFTYTVEGYLLFFDRGLVIDPDLHPQDVLKRQAAKGGWGDDTDNLEDKIRIWLDNALTFYVPSAEEILEDYRTAHPEGGHPSILTQDFDLIKEGMKKDPAFKKQVEELIKRGDTTVDKGVVKFKVTDLAGNTNIASMCQTMDTAAFAYAMTGDEKYKKFIADQLAEIKAGGADFTKGQFLGTAGAAYGIAKTYDWMYNYWTEEERKDFEEVLYSLLTYLKTAFTSLIYGHPTSNSGGGGNQNLIINGGIMNVAIALLDDHPEMASQLVEETLMAVRWFFPELGPEGAYPEGLSYWLYASDYIMPFFLALECAFGTDYGISESPGVLNMQNYAMSTKGSTAGFNLGDASPQDPMHPIFMYIGGKTGNMGLVNYRKSKANSSTNDVFGWVFDSGDEMVTPETFEHDAYFTNTGNITMRTGWSRSDTALYFHGGANNDGHGHRDTGNVLFDMSGERWGDEFPKEDYNISLEPANKAAGFTQPFFRVEGEGHNLVIANLSAENERGVEFTAKGYVERVELGDIESYAIMDLTETNSLYEYGLRGVKLNKIKNEVIIQDDYKSKSPTHFWWFMNFKNTEIEVSEDGKSAILTKNGKQICAILDSDGGEKFQVLEAKPLEMHTHPKAPYETPNDDYIRLGVYNPSTDHFKLTVTFRPVVSGTDPLADATDTAHMSSWKLASAERAKLTGITVDGKPLEGFSPDVYGYDIEVMTEKDPVPELNFEAPSQYDVEVADAESVPGIATVLLKRGGKLEGMYTVSITPLNDTRRFINDKQIPIKSFTVTSEPESQNPGSNLFDGSLDTKYATNETGGSVTVDYGQVRRIADVMMSFPYGDRYVKVKIEYSVDGYEFKTAFDGQSADVTKELQSFDFETFEARYLKVSFYGTSVGSSWTSITELCAFEE